MRFLSENLHMTPSECFQELLDCLKKILQKFIKKFRIIVFLFMDFHMHCSMDSIGNPSQKKTFGMLSADSFKNWFRESETKKSFKKFTKIFLNLSMVLFWFFKIILYFFYFFSFFLPFFLFKNTSMDFSRKSFGIPSQISHDFIRHLFYRFLKKILQGFIKNFF